MLFYVQNQKMFYGKYQTQKHQYNQKIISYIINILALQIDIFVL